MPNLLTLQLTCLHSNKKLWKQEKYISTSLYLLLNTERFLLIILSIQFFDRPCESNQIFLTMTVTLREFFFFSILGNFIRLAYLNARAFLRKLQEFCISLFSKNSFHCTAKLAPYLHYFVPVSNDETEVIWIYNITLFLNFFLSFFFTFSSRNLNSSNL